MEVTTPAVLVSMVSLSMLASTNRFFGLASRTRELCSKYQQCPSPVLWEQINKLGLRVRLIRLVQAFSVSSLILFVLSVFLTFEGVSGVARLAFQLGLILVMSSLCVSAAEISLSTDALQLQIDELRDPSRSSL